jgi:hypothetical protein
VQIGELVEDPEEPVLDCDALDAGLAVMCAYVRCERAVSSRESFM